MSRSSARDRAESGFLPPLPPAVARLDGGGRASRALAALAATPRPRLAAERPLAAGNGSASASSRSAWTRSSKSARALAALVRRRRRGTFVPCDSRRRGNASIPKVRAGAGPFLPSGRRRPSRSGRLHAPALPSRPLLGDQALAAAKARPQSRRTAKRVRSPSPNGQNSPLVQADVAARRPPAGGGAGRGSARLASRNGR
jgi:hypothetical protein